MAHRTFTFAVYNLAEQPPFEAFLIDVPADDEDKAARRAWFAAFHRLGPLGIEPEQMQVCVWRDGRPGEPVDSQGVIRTTTQGGN